MYNFIYLGSYPSSYSIDSTVLPSLGLSVNELLIFILYYKTELRDRNNHEVLIYKYREKLSYVQMNLKVKNSNLFGQPPPLLPNQSTIYAILFVLTKSLQLPKFCNFPRLTVLYGELWHLHFIISWNFVSVGCLLSAESFTALSWIFNIYWCTTQLAIFSTK